MNTSRRNARGELSLQTILEQTVSLVSSYGYDGTTIARISKSTGRPASSIYWYFDTKDDLVAAALESTYSRRPGDLPRWPEYTPDLPLEAQLYRALGHEFTPAETEAPVRLGIMVALEGIAANSPAQKPFQERRRLTSLHVQTWWIAATVDRVGLDRGDVAEWMTLLTLAFLDGHYISDVTADAMPSYDRGGQMVASALTSVFEYLASRPAPLPPARVTISSPVIKPPSIEDGAGDPLLATTRSLVAERGYEGATLSRICARSGVQRSSIYWRYKGKDELIHAAVTSEFLDLGATSKLPPPDGAAWLNMIAANLQESVEVAWKSPDTVRAGLLLKLQRRDPSPLGSQAIQQGVAQEAAALEQWITSAVELEGQHVDVNEIGWILNILREGLFLGVAFGYEYPARALSGQILAMVQGIVAASQQATGSRG
ncbi:TetR/AcrR family transcriptional regulator [Arthrobacter sp. SDTb3-6]|uniref:TetR/AcrR family transcriptional regulator n=1 Tax=Arthrobacter sp. SDTb3-6 TaxID=2713571 RepID=UPI00159E5C02|nr:TetR/AcrR family transcriptional regulator [Arthrobacter sp. SDTb3-6]NVN00180.1 TetR/AcrR family transcriptional regulator [Arthrobacter sp. SDTb3-6]